MSIEPKLIREGLIAPSEIVTEGRLRPLDPAAVEALAAAIQADGAIRNPVHLRRVKGQRGKDMELRLIAGAHRVAAAAQLGIEVPAKIWECTQDQAAMMEIDDQVAGRSLEALDLSVFLARRKAVFEKLHPAMAKGGFRGNQHTGNVVPEIISFTTSTAAQFGMTERHVRNFVKVGETLEVPEINNLRAAEKPVGVVELLAIVKIHDRDERAKVCGLIGRGAAKTVSKALDAAKGVSTPVQSPVDLDLQRLLDAWGRASMAAKRAFAEERGDELAGLLPLGDESEAA